MAKRISGEQSLKVGEKTYTLRLDFEILSEIEDRYGSIIEIMASFGVDEPKLSLVAFLFSQMASIEQTEAFAITMENKADVFERILDVIVSTLNPEKEKGSNTSGE